MKFEDKLFIDWKSKTEYHSKRELIAENFRISFGAQRHWYIFACLNRIKRKKIVIGLKSETLNFRFQLKSVPEIFGWHFFLWRDFWERKSFDMGKVSLKNIIAGLFTSILSLRKLAHGIQAFPNKKKCDVVCKLLLFPMQHFT